MRFTLLELLQMIWDNICRHPDIKNTILAALWGGLILNVASLAANYLIIDNEATLLWLRAVWVCYHLCIVGFVVATAFWRRF